MVPEESSGRSIKQIQKILIVTSIGLTLLGLFIVPNIVPIIFPEYNEAISAIQIISLAVIPSTISLLLTSKILGNEKSKILPSTRIIFAVIFIGLVVTLTPIYGIVGTTMGFVVASIAQCIILIVYYKFK